MKEATELEMLSSVLEWMGWKLKCSSSIHSCELLTRDGIIKSRGQLYLTLDLMHEAESKLRRDDLKKYNAALCNEIDSGCRVCDFESAPSDFGWHATKEQRLRALYLTKPTARLI